MKKTIIFLLALSVVLVGCGGPPAEEVSSQNKSDKIGGTTEKKGAMETDGGLKPDGK
ncbi:MAG: hypothetical protein ABL949_11895 [Fimbriimonadaceae bacterium]